MITKKEFIKQQMFEMHRLREKIDAICARYKCDHLADSFEAISRNTAVMLRCLSNIEGSGAKDLHQMVLASLALELQLIEKCASVEFAEAFAECFTAASNSLDECFKGANK